MGHWWDEKPRAKSPQPSAARGKVGNHAAVAAKGAKLAPDTKILILVAVAAFGLIGLLVLSLSAPSVSDDAARMQSNSVHDWMHAVADGDNGGSAANGVAAGGIVISERDREMLEHLRADGALREATDTMDAQALRRAIADAKLHHRESSPAYRTATFVLQHLANDKASDAPRAASEEEAPAAAADELDSDLPPEPAQAFQLPPPPESVLPLLGAGTPLEYAWWSTPPASLAKLLPPPEIAMLPEPIPGETAAQTQARFDAIVATIEPRFRPGEFPIGVVAYNRPRLLERCLDSLLAVPGVTKEQVKLYQDGTDAAVRTVAAVRGVRVSQHTGNENGPGQDGAMQIARHYLFVLRGLFADNPSAQYALVVEDDMIFADDFLLLFSQLAPLYESDKSVYCISSWNDNGLSGMASDPRVVRRTDFFVGLGWMVSRRIFEEELSERWPASHWDHWLREPAQRKGRQCIYPEVSRNYNIGKIGTHSDEALYEKYFERIVLNKQPAVWLGDIARLHSSSYESSLLRTLSSATQVSSLAQLKQYTSTQLVLFVEMANHEDKRFEKLYSQFFGLFHSVPFIRGIYRDGVLQFRWPGAGAPEDRSSPAAIRNANYLSIVTSYAQQFASLRRPDTPLLTGDDFQVDLASLRVFRALRPAPGLRGGGENCHQVCRRRSENQEKPELECSPGGMMRINECDVMKTHFSCARCEDSSGKDQPAWVHNRKMENYGFCLRNVKEPECDGAHPETLRLCACKMKGK